MDELLELTNVWIVDPLLGEVASEKQHEYAPWSESYSFKRQFIVLWAFLYISSMFVYILFGSSTFFAFFVKQRTTNLDPNRKEHHAIGGKTHAHTENPAYWPWDNQQIRNEMWVSTWSLFIMAGLTACVDMYFLLGGSKLYKDIDEYGYVYFFLSPFLFLFFTDALIYWIHRILHWPSVYWLHKLHHYYKETTPWSAFSFHPLDGFAQSFPYHLFVMFFPMHSRLYTLTLMIVGLWTVNIHDRMTLRLWGVNGAAHHTIHHTKFNYNYGQYFTWSDQLFGTFKDPYQQWPYELDETVLEKVKKDDLLELQAARKVAPVFLPDPDLPENQQEEKKKKKAQ